MSVLDPHWVFSLPPGATVVPQPPSGLAIQTGAARFTLANLPPALIRGLSRLASPGVAGGELFAESRSLAEPLFHLQELANRGLLSISVVDGGRPLATLVPTSPAFSVTALVAGPDQTAAGRFILSQFACIRRSAEEIVVETPLAAARVILHDDPLAALLLTLRVARSIGGFDGLSAQFPDLAPPIIASFLKLVRAAKIVTPIDEQGLPADDEQSAAASGWEFHDLSFHAASRIGRRDAALGGTYPGLARSDPPPALRPPRAAQHAPAIPLFRPAAADLDSGPPLFEVIERRHSVRAYGAAPIALAQLGEFLYRTARVRDRHVEELEGPQGIVPLEITSRPYPSGGALYELEVYPVIRRCDGLAPGIYHYDPLEHCLRQVSGPTPTYEALLADAAYSTWIEPSQLQTLLVFTARFPRIYWKYQAIGYALLLKHVGVLMQTMYLAATGMKLAPCALGVGDSDIFARAIKSDYYQETSVGEFLLGSLP